MTWRNPTSRPWTRHAGRHPRSADDAQPLPEAARRLGRLQVSGWIADFYARLAAAGFEYGPAFQGYPALGVRRRGSVSAEVELTGCRRPVNLRHPSGVARRRFAPAGDHRWRPDDGPVCRSTGRVSGCMPPAPPRVRVTLRAAGRTAVPDADIFDTEGHPVATAEALTARAVTADQLTGRRPAPPVALFRPGWSALPVRHRSPGPPRSRRRRPRPRPAVRRCDYLAGPAVRPDRSGRTSPTGRAQRRPTPARCRASSPTPRPTPAWPSSPRGRRAPVTTSPTRPRAGLGAGALGAVRASGPLRSGRPDDARAGSSSSRWRWPPVRRRWRSATCRLLAPRLSAHERRRPRRRRTDPDRAVLITGGTGALGRLVARHLVDAHGVRHLVLVSRRGETAPGAAELREELTGAGARVSVAAADLTDRAAVRELIDKVTTERPPLGAVLHAAGLLDDGVLESLTPQRLHPVLAAKVDAARTCTSATRGLPLAAFALFSSAPALRRRRAGQLRRRERLPRRARRHRRSPACPAPRWPGACGSRSRHDRAAVDRDRARRPVSHGRGPDPDRAPGPAGCRAGAGTDACWYRCGSTSPCWHGGRNPRRCCADWCRPGRRRTVGQPGAVADRRLAELAGPEEQVASCWTRPREVAWYSGYAVRPVRSTRPVLPGAGFDSLTAVELRNRLGAASGRGCPRRPSSTTRRRRRWPPTCWRTLAPPRVDPARAADRRAGPDRGRAARPHPRRRRVAAHHQLAAVVLSKWTQARRAAEGVAEGPRAGVGTRLAACDGRTRSGRS